MDNLSNLRAELKSLGSLQKSKNSAWFFKSGPGEYAEGDVFLGVTVPEQRKLAKKYLDLSLADAEILLLSKLHEERFVSLIILVDQFRRGDEKTKKQIYDFYIQHAKNVNNWDLVDGSAEFIVGPWIENKDQSILTQLAESDNIWEKRIAMLSTFYFIKQGDPRPALQIAEILLNDENDLIQKAVGWMLREIGKRCSLELEENFLLNHYKTMPRTSLRYAIERFPEDRRQQFLKGSLS